MAIRYTAEKAKQLAELHKLAVNDHCLGFATWDCSTEKIMETIYALTATGKIYTSSHLRSNEFNTTGRKWSLNEEVPPEAEFIGCYPRPTACH